MKKVMKLSMIAMVASLVVESRGAAEGGKDAGIAQGNVRVIAPVAGGAESALIQRR